MLRLDSKIAVLGVLALAAGAAACSPPPPVDTTKQVSLSIVSVSPSAVYNEGGDTVTVTTANGCTKDNLSIKIGDVPIAGDSITQPDGSTSDNYAFPAPALGSDAKTTTSLTVTCVTPAKQTPQKEKYVAGKNTATAPFTYDPSLEPQPVVKTYSPSGNTVSVLAKMVVTFSRDMDPNSISPDTVYIHGIPGTTTYDAPTRTATFTPGAQLPYGTPEICVVKGGSNGVHSLKTGKTLATHIAPGGGAVDPNQDSWSFTTRCEGCGNPWLGDISAAAGISTGGNYKLFSVTGAPTPVGTAYAGTADSHTYQLQSGFLYATQPSGN